MANTGGAETTASAYPKWPMSRIEFSSWTIPAVYHHHKTKHWIVKSRMCFMNSMGQSFWTFSKAKTHWQYDSWQGPVPKAAWFRVATLGVHLRVNDSKEQKPHLNRFVDFGSFSPTIRTKQDEAHEPECRHVC